MYYIICIINIIALVFLEEKSANYHFIVSESENYTETRLICNG